MENKSRAHGRYKSDQKRVRNELIGTFSCI